jgi:murein DD-endopeptidase MepM/ murein hydrolase activator NlpD
MRGLLVGLVLAIVSTGPTLAQSPPKTPAPAAASTDFACLPTARQGGAILCRAAPGSEISLDGVRVARADVDGLAIIGLKRSQKSPAHLSVLPSQMAAVSPIAFDVKVLKRKDDVGTLEMACEQISPQSPENQKKAEISWAKKEKALKLFNAPLGPVGMAKPVDVSDEIYSTSSFGKTRTYIPKTKDCKQDVKVHNGTDIGVGVGTEIHAPMAGTVILADPDLYFEGGCVFLDMGRGLVSVTMHMSRIDVKPGQVVKQGELLGLSGKTGRVTGPHVHWGIKYRNVFETDRGTDIWLDPMLVMKLDATKLN